MSDPTWNAALKPFAAIGDIHQLLSNPDDPQLQAEVQSYALLSLVQGYTMASVCDPDFPLWMPWINWPFHSHGACPDMKYLYAPINEDGVYRIWGKRNTVRVVLFQFARQFFGGPFESIGEALQEFEFDDLKFDPDGCFDVMVSKVRPTDWSGDWWRLPDGACNALIREVYGDWNTEIGLAVNIERVDRPSPMPPRKSAQRVQREVAAALQHAGGATRAWAKAMGRYRRDGLINRFEISGLKELGGMYGQAYYQCSFEFGENEALIVATDIPGKFRYWDIQLADEMYVPIDYCNRTSCYNDMQAHIAHDGRFYSVVADRDPGVPNWLDSGGYRLGIMLGRWNRSDSAPVPTITRAPLSEVRKHLPPDTPDFTSEQRLKQIELRRSGYRKRFGF